MVYTICTIFDESWKDIEIMSEWSSCFESETCTFIYQKVRGDIKIPHSRMTKTCRETLVCEMYAASHKRPFVPYVGVSDYHVMYRQSFVKHLQRSQSE